MYVYVPYGFLQHGKTAGLVQQCIIWNCWRISGWEHP